MTKLGSFALFSVLLSLASCSKSTDDMTAAKAADSGAPMAATATVAPIPAPTLEASAPAKPPPMAVTSVPSDKLGTLAPGTGVPVGQRIPEVRARDLDGKEVSLTSLAAQGPILLVFYRGGWCPFCNSEIHALSEAAPDFEKRGVKLVALSVDKPNEGAKTKALYHIPFPVLSDPEGTALEAFKVVNRVSDEQLGQMRSHGVDLEQYSGKKHHIIAIPSFFLIDREKIVRWAHSDRDFKVRPSVAQLLGAVDATLSNLPRK
jgi:peroxiredoxin